MRPLAQYPVLAPSYAEIRPTNACQLDCVGCWYYSPHVAPPQAAWKRQQLAQPVFGELLDDLADAQFKQITFSGGGEPLAHPAIYELLDAAAARFEVVLVSNVLLCKDPDRLARTRVRTLLANFSAGSAGTYTKYHPNQPGESFDRLLAILRRLSRDLSVTLSCVLGRVNCDDIPGMLRVAAETTQRIHFKTMRATGPALMTPVQRAHLEASLPAYADLADQLGLSHNLRAYQVDSDAPPISTASCFAPYYTTVIHAGGAVTVCCQAEQDVARASLGNVNEVRFRDLWRSPAYDERREALEARRFEPWCEGCVYFAHNHALTGAVARIEGREARR